MRNSLTAKCVLFIKQHKINLLVLSGIFLIFVFFRFTNLAYRLPFAWDQEQFSTQVRDIIRDHKFTLLGPRVTDDRGFFLAPYFTYILIPFFLITRLHPSALLIFTITVNILFFCFAAYTLYSLFGTKRMLLFLFLWSVNPILVKYDTTPWWPILLPIGVLALLYELKLLYSHKNNLYLWSLIGITIGFFCNMHFQFIFMGAFTAIFIVTMANMKIWKYWKGIVLMAFSFFAMFLPLVLFDLRHNHLNYTLFTTYFSERVLDDLPYMEAWLPVFANIVKPLTSVTYPFITVVFLIIQSTIFIYFAVKKEGFNRIFFISSFVLLCTTILGFSLYGKRPSEYYFTYFLPFIYIAVTEVIVTLNKRVLTIGIILVLLFINATELKNSIKPEVFNLSDKDAAVRQIIPFAKDSRVNVSYDMPLGLNNGYDYFIDYYKINRTGDPNDPLIEIRIPPKENDIVVNNIGIHIPPELR